jgi:hypothetical protein
MATVQLAAKPARKKAVKTARKQLATKAARKQLGTTAAARDGTTRFDLSPQWAVVRRSTIDGAGLGLFAAKDIPAGFCLGEYVGTVRRGLGMTSTSAYIWELKPRNPRLEGEMIWIDGEEYGDGLLHDTPNNLRYVNCADEEDEINTKMVQHDDKVYYRTARAVHKGEELLMTYGSGYWDGDVSHGKTKKKRRAEDGTGASELRSSVETTITELCCSITKALPVDPVAAEDGRVYEREAIERWMQEKPTSPVTSEPMGATLRPAAQVRSTVRAVAQWAGDRGKKVVEQMRHEEEFRAQKQLAVGDDRDAMLTVALAYADGRGVATNKESAYRWALRAAEHGSVKALYLMPVISGHNSQSKAIVALDWQEAALRGDARACVNVAGVYVGQPDDGDERAKRWYQKAVQCEPSAEGGGRFKTDDEMAKQEASEWLEAHKDVVCNWKC